MNVFFRQWLWARTYLGVQELANVWLGMEQASE